MCSNFFPKPGPFNESAYYGRQMQAGMAKQRCALQSGFFDKSFKRVFEREAMSDPLRLARQNRILQAKKNLGKAFLPCNGAKKLWENTHRLTIGNKNINMHQNIHLMTNKKNVYMIRESH